VPAQHEQAFVLGVDLGQASDPTALAVLHWQRVPLEDAWTTGRGKDLNINRQSVETRFDIVHLERVPLATPYPEIVAYIAEILGRRPLREGCDLVIDETGVGRAVGDMFDASGLRPVRVTITAGLEVTKASARSWHVPKGLLVSTLDAKLHAGELRFAKELSEAGALAEELKDFQRSVTAAGRPVLEASPFLRGI
jgi:hypothetical protein